MPVTTTVPSLDWLATAAAVGAFLAAKKAMSFIAAAYQLGSKSHALVYLPARKSRGLVALMVGHVHDMAWGMEPAGESVFRWFDELRAIPGKRAIGIRLLASDIIMLTEPADVEYVLLQNGPNFVKGADIYEGVAMMLGNHSLVAMRDEQVHSVQRRLVNPAFSAASLKEVNDTAIAPCVEAAMAAIVKHASRGGAGGAPFAVEPVWDTMTLDIIAKAAFRETNVDGTSISDQFRAMTIATAKAPHIFLPGGSAIKTKATRVIAACGAEIRRVSMTFADKVRQAAAAESASVDATGGVPRRKTLIEYMTESPELTNQMIGDHNLTFLFAGHETTSTALSWLCFELATRPAVQAQLYDELRDAFGLDQLPDLETLRTLRFLDNTVREILRLRSPIAGMRRTVIADDILPSGVFLRAGSQIHITIQGMHRSKKVYGPDANEFRPDRWDDAALVERVGQGGWLPFLLGKRNCIGKDFAWNELLVSVATMVRRFELLWPVGQAAPVPKIFLATRTVAPIEVIFRARTL